MKISVVHTLIAVRLCERVGWLHNLFLGGVSVLPSACYMRIPLAVWSEAVLGDDWSESM